MNKTTPDPGTPIFGELNKELGELPEITVHDFDSHGFGFGLTDEPSEESDSSDDPAADATPAPETPQTQTTSQDTPQTTSQDTSQASAQNTSQGTTKMPKPGGRRRKEN